MRVITDVHLGQTVASLALNMAHPLAAELRGAVIALKFAKGGTQTDHLAAIGAAEAVIEKHDKNIAHLKRELASVQTLLNRVAEADELRRTLDGAIENRAMLQEELGS